MFSVVAVGSGGRSGGDHAASVVVAKLLRVSEVAATITMAEIFCRWQAAATVSAPGGIFIWQRVTGCNGRIGDGLRVFGRQWPWRQQKALFLIDGNAAATGGIFDWWLLQQRWLAFLADGDDGQFAKAIAERMAVFSFGVVGSLRLARHKGGARMSIVASRIDDDDFGNKDARNLVGLGDGVTEANEALQEDDTLLLGAEPLVSAEEVEAADNKRCIYWGLKTVAGSSRGLWHG